MNWDNFTSANNKLTWKRSWTNLTLSPVICLNGPHTYEEPNTDRRQNHSYPELQSCFFRFLQRWRLRSSGIRRRVTEWLVTDVYRGGGLVSSYSAQRSSVQCRDATSQKNWHLSKGAFTRVPQVDQRGWINQSEPCKQFLSTEVINGVDGWTSWRWPTFVQRRWFTLGDSPQITRLCFVSLCMVLLLIIIRKKLFSRHP